MEGNEQVMSGEIREELSGAISVGLTGQIQESAFY